MPLAQDNQFLKMETPLGPDVLVIQEFKGTESVSRPFTFEVRALSEQDGIDATTLIGKPVSVSVETKKTDPRYYHGIVVGFSVGALIENRYREYSLRIQPWFSLLEYRHDCRIFQNQNAKDIITSVFSELGFSDFQWKLQNTPAVREYCVQYRESDFSFVHRLLEEEGIFYFFKHEAGKHTLVLCDYLKGYEAVPIDALDVTDGSHADFSIKNWVHDYQFRSGVVSHSDYNFTTPATSLLTDQKTLLKLANTAQYDVYDYPGEYEDKSIGGFFARNRMEAIEAGYTSISASSDYMHMTAGYIFNVNRHHAEQDAKKGYVLTKVVHHIREGSYRSNGESFDYHNTFVCVPEEVILRPARTTPKPYIRGNQSAIVVGPSGEEIYTDEFGRVKVQFYWDRLGKHDENSSCWIRVAQFWAGKNWGAQFIPRIGHEVLVNFTEGDPDRPLIVGSVYNAENMPPYGLPTNKDHSGIKSRSTKGGGTANFNELRFEDEKGQELFYLHAEKDEEEIVENDQTVEIGNDQTITVGHDSTESIGNDLTQSVGNNKSLDTGNNHTESVGNNMDITVSNNRSLNVSANHDISVGANQSTSVSGNDNLSVSGNLSENVSGNFTHDANNITITGKSKITLKVGSSSVVIDGSGVTIKGGGATGVFKGSKAKIN
ncbi:MAG: type VI secretion system tip protein VgrG [Pseudomonadales bacterium]|nr:type VI secretion system tip protein VgrG [Pseudomonadales bacterium]